MTQTLNNRLAIYKDGEMHIQDLMVLDDNGVLRTQCRGLTLADYVRENGEGFVVMSLDEACERIHKLQDEAYIKPFIEITEDQYNEMLECLPPQKWMTVDGVSIFRMSEYQTSNITGHYASYNGRYFMANRRTNVNYEDIAQEIRSNS